jgi:peptide/nickel transport system substrate-binding protein
VFQLRPEVARPVALFDARVRRALVRLVNREEISEAVWAGQAVVADFTIPPSSRWGKAVERGVVTYPLDPRAAAQLMAEAGFRKGADGIYVSADGERFAAELRTSSGATSEKELSIMADGWRQAGFDVREFVLPAQLVQDPQARASFPSMYTYNRGVGDSAMLGHRSAEIPSTENRWFGNNRGGWSNPEYDRLVDAFTSTLDPTTRAEHVARLARIFSEELPAISLFFQTNRWVHVAALKGMELVAPEAHMSWNIHEWEFR